MASGKFLNDASVSAALLSALDPAADYFLAHDATASAAVKILASQILNRLTSSGDISHLSALANLAAVDMSNDKFLVFDADGPAFKTLTGAELVQKVLTKATVTGLTSMTTVESVDMANDVLLLWDNDAAAFKALTASQVIGKLWQGPKVNITSTPIGSPTITAALSGTLYHNATATVAITVNLPAATAGTRFSFARVASYDITLDGNSTETINGALTYTLSSFGRVDIECFVNGSWIVTSSNTSQGRVFNVRSYGAAGNGSTNDTSAFDAAFAAAGADDTVEIPAGDYVLNPLATITATGGITVKGAGRFSTILRFVPTADNQSLFNIDRTGSSPTSGLAFSDFMITTADTSYSKTALKITDGSETRISNVGITNWLGNTNSVGLWTLGRESLWAHEFFVEATVPIRIGVNPNASIDADHFTFSNCYLTIPASNIPSSLVSAIILVDSGVHITQLQFVGSQAWVGGRYGLYWVDTSDVSPVCSGILLDNVRTEQGVSPSSYYSVYISVNAGSGISANKVLQNLTIRNCEFEAARNGVYLRNVWYAEISNSVLMQASTVVGVDVGYAFNFIWRNNRSSSSAGTTYITADSNLVLARAEAHVNGLPWPANAVWTRRSTAATYAERPQRLMSAHAWYWSGTLADDGQVQLPSNADSNAWLHARIKVTATIPASNVLEYGEWYAAPVTGLTNGVVKASGSTNTASADSDTYLCVYCDGASPMYAGVYVKNRLGASAYVTVEVYGKRSVET